MSSSNRSSLTDIAAISTSNTGNSYIHGPNEKSKRKGSRKRGLKDITNRAHRDIQGIGQLKKRPVPMKASIVSLPLEAPMYVFLFVFESI